MVRDRKGLIRGVTATAFGVALVAVVASGSPAAEKEPTCAPEGSALTISANNSKFNKDCLVGPVNEAFTIAFENQEDVPHNVSIYDTANGKKTLFKGQVFNGPKTVTYDVPAIAEGRYEFICDPHKDKMIGTFIVGNPPPPPTTTTAPPTTTTTAGLLPTLGLLPN